MKKTIYLYLGSKYIGELKVENVRMRETYMFQFAAEYLNPKNPILDPSIANVRGPQFPSNGGIFGFLSDVAPDRWGRKLIRRKEKRELSESDFLLGVCDATRQGALRLKPDKDGPFVSDDTKDAAPPWTTLRKLESAALHIDADDHGGEEERWVRDLFAPGSSLGGARPKANVTSPDGSVWIAKFPSVKDDWDVGLKEYEASVLARKAGLVVPETQCKKLSKAGTTFFSKRFDRNGDEIQVGMHIRMEDGSIERVYATIDVSGKEDLGINASNEDYLKFHPFASREYYSLSNFDLRRVEIVEQKVSTELTM